MVSKIFQTNQGIISLILGGGKWSVDNIIVERLVLDSAVSNV